MNDFEKYLNLCFRYLKIRPRSKKEISDYLERKKLKEEIANKIIIYLQNNSYLNDVNFAKWWVNQRLLNKPRSIYLLKLELINKGVSKNICDDLFFEEKINDLKTAINLLGNKRSLFQGDFKYKQQRIINFLLRKGYSYHVAKKAFEELHNKM